MKKSLSFLPPWEFQTPLSLGTPKVLINLPRKWLFQVHLVKAMVFPVIMYGYDSWTMKMAEHQSIDASKLWCWRRLLRLSWTTRRSNQSILKEINSEYSLEGLMLTVKLQYFGHLMQRADSLEKTDARKDWRREEKGMAEDGWMVSMTQWTWIWANSRRWWWTGKLGRLQ